MLERTLHTLLANVSHSVSIRAGDPLIRGIAYDSRKVQPGTLFVAIRGTHTDGHRYSANAVARGAVAIVADQRFWEPQVLVDAAGRPVPVVVVPNSLVALAPIAATWYGYPGRALGVVGITGTKGKTTTTELTSRVLEGGGFATGMIGTLDFKIGARQWPNDTRQSTPEALEVQQMLREMVDAGCDYAVIEATSHALSDRWNRLGGCDFDAAVFMNVTHEHLDFHGSVEQYRQDKARLFTLLGEHTLDESGSLRRVKWAIVNADDPYHQVYLDAAPGTAHRLMFGMHAHADVRAEQIEATATGTHAQVVTPWGTGALTLQLPGLFNLVNGLAAISVGLSQGVQLDYCLAALGAVAGVRGRMQSVAVGQPFAVIVDYAHNPDSFEQVMAMLRPLTSGRMIVVFGSAGERDRVKRPIQGAIAGRYCQYVVLTDEDPRGEDREAILVEIAAGVEQAGLQSGFGYVCIPDRAEAVRHAIAHAQTGDLVLLLGKGHEASIQYDGYSIAWDEVAVAREALAALGYG